MTRRERMMTLLRGYSGCQVDWAKRQMEARYGYALWTDQAVDELARQVVANHRRSQKLNAESRARRASKGEQP